MTFGRRVYEMEILLAIATVFGVLASGGLAALGYDTRTVRTKE